MVRNVLRKTAALAGRELTSLWRDKTLRGILLLGTVLGLLLFWSTYWAQVLKSIPTAIVDLDQSSASREFVELVKNAENLQVMLFVPSFEELRELIERGEVAVGVVIPQNFGKDVALGRRARVEVIIDGSNIIYATNATSAALAVARTAGAQASIKTLAARGVHPLQAQDAYQSIVFREEPWFNPTLNYAFFLVVALALNVWQQCCTLAASTTIIGEVGSESWVQLKAAGVPAFHLFATKAAVHIALYTLLALPVYAVSYGFFSVPLHAKPAELILFTAAFAAALHGVGTFVSSFAGSALNSTRFGMLVALPSFILSGYTWPLEAMPPFIQHLARLLPQTWFFQGFNYLTFKGADLTFMSRYYLVLVTTAAACYAASAVVYTLRANKRVLGGWPA